jgi:hypothetical protein
LIKEQEIDEQNNTTATVIPLERLFVIRGNIQQFLRKWNKEVDSE